MSLPAGVFQAKKKSGQIYYRASLTYKGRHISLGSYDTSEKASTAYQTARVLLENRTCEIADYVREQAALPFEKWVCLINVRDNGIYFKNPIYLKSKYFEYYYDEETVYKFDVDDLFFYSKHKIMKRNGHLFVADYGMQLNILSRYGIHNHSVMGRDYIFVNGDRTDFRYMNIKVLNHYKGVSHKVTDGRDVYTAKIHINGDFIIGRYQTEEEAAAAYNKAIHILKEKGVKTAYEENYIEELNSKQYASLYQSVKISAKILNYKM